MDNNEQDYRHLHIRAINRQVELQEEQREHIRTIRAGVSFIAFVVLCQVVAGIVWVIIQFVREREAEERANRVRESFQELQDYFRDID